MGSKNNPDYHREYYQRNKEKLKAASRRNYHAQKNNPAFKARVKLRRELGHFGVSRDVIFEKTGGKCSRCDNRAEIVHHMDGDGRTYEKVGLEPGKDASRWNASVHMPRIGCGLAGGSWGKVEPIIQEELCDKGVQVFVYDLQAKGQQC